MIKKISVTQLEPGMHVHDFNHDWRNPCCQDRDPNAFRNGRTIATEAEVKAVIEHGIQTVFINDKRGRDVSDAPTVIEVEKVLTTQMEALGDDAKPENRPPSSLIPQEVHFDQEVSQASNIKAQARKLVGSVLEDARMGQQVTLGPVKDVVRHMADSLFRNPDAMLSLSLIKQRDEYTFMHSVNVGVFLMSFCRTMEMDESAIIDVGVGGMLHDIGKMKTPESVLNKAGKLTDEEFDLMKQHVVFSRKILEGTAGISETSTFVAAQHHERYDGSGYPKHLKGDEINVFGQMAAIVDVYDAITSDRCYHKGNPPHLALKRMLDWSQYHFSKPLYQKFVQCVGIYPTGTLVRLENKLLGVVIRPNRESLLCPVVNIIMDAGAGRRLKPKEVDLLVFKDRPEKGFKITRSESPEKWKVNPQQYMPKPKLYQ